MIGENSHDSDQTSKCAAWGTGRVRGGRSNRIRVRVRVRVSRRARLRVGVRFDLDTILGVRVRCHG